MQVGAGNRSSNILCLTP